MSQLDAVLDILRGEINKYVFLKQISDKFEAATKINFEYVVLAAIVIVGLMLFSGYGANLICHAVAFLYPLYATLVVMNHGVKGPSTQFWLVINLSPRLFTILLTHIHIETRLVYAVVYNEQI